MNFVLFPKNDLLGKKGGWLPAGNHQNFAEYALFGAGKKHKNEFFEVPLREIARSDSQVRYLREFPIPGRKESLNGAMILEKTGHSGIQNAIQNDHKIQEQGIALSSKMG